MLTELEKGKTEIIEMLEQRVRDGVIEPANGALLTKLIHNADTLTEAINIAELGTTYKRTGFHFDKRLEKMGNTIKYLKRNESLSFDGVDKAENRNTLIIGDNYDALQSLLITHVGAVDIIYIDPPYGKDDMGEFAATNYVNNITRDNLLSMLYPRLVLAKRLLSSDGIIVCSIDDRNLAYVTAIMNDIFLEARQLFVAPRLTKRGGKNVDTIQKHHDYLIAYGNSDSVVFQRKPRDTDSFTMEDEYVDTRGRYKLTQTLDYNSLQYSPSLDYVITLDGKEYVPGGDIVAFRDRQAGNHQAYDWAWRWSKAAFEWGLQNGFIVVKGSRIYTKTYEKCRKKERSLEIEYIESKKAYSTVDFVDNKYSNDIAKKDLDSIFGGVNTPFDNPKPVGLIMDLIRLFTDKEDACILDFFAGSGTTGQAVLQVNRDDNKACSFILCTNNEITEKTPNGIAIDVTTKRLHRTMRGACYNGSRDYKWTEKNTPLGGSLDVYEIDEISDFDHSEGHTPFDVIDETAYGQQRFQSREDKIKWICENFSNTRKYLEE